MTQQHLFIRDTRAVFSGCRLYRYELWRRWGPSDRFVNFIGVNPSTADEYSNDPTIRKCIKFAQSWGYDALCMTNLFAYRSRDPKALSRVEDPTGNANDRHLIERASEAAIVIACWGRNGEFLERDKEVLSMIDRDIYCIRKLADGVPEHPLYIPGSTRPIKLTDL